LSQLERLLSDAEEDVPAAESEAYESARFEDPGERETAVGWLRANPTSAGLLLLLALRRERGSLNDFGYIDAEGGYDREAGKALLELGEAAVGPLAEELDDMNPGQLEGSEEATLTDIYDLRRADFAYRYLARILGMQPKFDRDPAVRDEHIAELRRRLGTR
jgi:hypothetical protein